MLPCTQNQRNNPRIENKERKNKKEASWLILEYRVLFRFRELSFSRNHRKVARTTRENTDAMESDGRCAGGENICSISGTLTIFV